MLTCRHDTRVVLYAVFLIFFIGAAAFAWPVPDTGQTTCYNLGIPPPEIPCPEPEDLYYGQDGSYTINPPSYTKLDAQGNDLDDSASPWVMVRDNVTGRIWEVKSGKKDKERNYSDPHDPDNTYTWYDSSLDSENGSAGTPGEGTDTEDFLNQLNGAVFGGFSNWRLPTVKELDSIAFLDNCSPEIDTAYFPTAEPPEVATPHTVQTYWASTAHASDPAYAWLYQYNCPGTFNAIHFRHKSFAYNVRAVRDGETATAPSGQHLVDNGDGTVTDTATGLMWQQATEADLTWPKALDYCEGIVLAGYSDWRCPSRKEIRSIVDYSTYDPAIDITKFPDTVADYYWTSSSLPSGAGWLFHFLIGYHSGWTKDSPCYVRAVRGGQNQVNGNLIILSPTEGSTWQIPGSMAITWETAEIGGKVRISLSREGGKDGTFETIVEGTPNDGSHTWPLEVPVSANCMLKMESLGDPSKKTVQGLFSITQVVDEIAPGVPTGLSATGVSSSQINLSWNPSTDNIGVTGYEVYRDGAYLKKVTGTSANDKGLTVSTEYCYKVSAFDWSGNESDKCAQACATTVTQYGVTYVDSEDACNGQTPCYTNIQEGILHTADQGSLLVKAGEYPEGLVMESDQKIALEGGMDSSMSPGKSLSVARSLEVGQGTLTIKSLGLDGSLQAP